MKCYMYNQLTIIGNRLKGIKDEKKKKCYLDDFEVIKEKVLKKEQLTQLEQIWLQNELNITTYQILGRRLEKKLSKSLDPENENIRPKRIIKIRKKTIS